MSRRLLRNSIIIFACIIVCVGAAFLFYKQFSQSPNIATYCVDSLGNVIFSAEGSVISAEFNDCIQHNAKLYLEKDYTLAVDLAKSFLTLLSGLLIASITFSEKIINLQSASQTARTLMICCWLFLLAAIVTCGVGLSLMTVGAGWAAYQPFTEFRMFETPAVYLFISSGLAFGCGMVSLLAAGIVSMNDNKLKGSNYFK